MLFVTGKHPFFGSDSFLAFAHRGGTGNWPENTLRAFRHAVDIGYKYVETDVHLTADGVVIAFHDTKLDRVTDLTGTISDLTWNQIREARVGGSDPIPLFEEILEEFPLLNVNIDPKHDAVVEPLANLLLKHKALDRVCVGSFSDRRIKHFQTLIGDKACTSAGPKGVARFRASNFGIGRPKFSFDCLQVPVRQSGITLVDEKFVVAAHEHNLQVHVWTIDDPTEMSRLLDLGVDGIMSDKPDLLKETLLQRGLWS